MGYIDGWLQAPDSDTLGHLQEEQGGLHMGTYEPFTVVPLGASETSKEMGAPRASEEDVLRHLQEDNE